MAKMGRHARVEAETDVEADANVEVDARAEARTQSAAQSQSRSRNGAVNQQNEPTKPAESAESIKPPKPTAWQRAVKGTFTDPRADHFPTLGMQTVFLIVVFAVMLAPLVGMIWAPTTTTTENRELAAAPALFDDTGAFNTDVLSDAGAWFDDHFAYRNELVSANAVLYSALGDSPTDQVIVGSDGWLFYGGTVSDFTGSNPLSDRALRSIAHNLSLIQDYATAHEAAFAFTIAPNKNTLYPQFMPYYYLPDSSQHNAERLVSYLEAEDVNYVDLFELFEECNDIRYLRTDSHWDNRGAFLAADKILDALAHEPLDAADDPEPYAGAVGDLQSMLVPVSTTRETNWHYPGLDPDDGSDADTEALEWSYSEGTDVTDDWIRTENDTSGGSILMFRDSFGNALAPYMASAYGSAAFSKLVPYNISDALAVDADAVVIERAERHLPYLAETAPLMICPRVTPDWELPAGEVGVEVEGEVGDDGNGRDGEARTSLSTYFDGPYAVVEGTVDPDYVSDDLQIYVEIGQADGTGVLYDTFWLCDSSTGEVGFKAYLNAATNDLQTSMIRVYGVAGGSAFYLM